MMNKILLPVLVILSLLLNVCNVEEKEAFDRKLLVTQLVNNVVIPRHEEFQSMSNELYQAAQEFRTAPTLLSFQELRQKWLESKLAYKRIAVFNFGAVRETVVHNKLNTWPTNTDFIDGFLEDTVMLDQQFVDGKGSSSKGLPALEYLLFDPSLSESEMHSALMNSTDSGRRLDLIEAYANDLYLRAMFLNQIWQPSGDDYGQVLATIEPTSGLNSPVEMLLGELIARTERIVLTELDEPMGVENDGIIDEHKSEAYRSRSSLLCVREGLVSAREVMLGDVQNGTGPASASLENHVIQCGFGDAANDAVQQLNTAISLIDSYSVTLEQGLQTDLNGLKSIRNEIAIVIPILRVDFVSALQATLTFNDNDGD